jgi:hypothetical protein
MRTASLLALGLALAIASPAAAQRYEYVGETEIGQFGGALYVDDVVPAGEVTPLVSDQAYPAPIERLRVRTATELGLRLTRHLSQKWSAEAHWSYGFSELLRTGPVADRTDEVSFDRLGIVQFGVALLYYPVWLADERIGPFVRAGLGALAWRPANDFSERERPLHTRRTSSLAGVLGAGLVYYATEDLSIRGEYQLTRARVDRSTLLGLEFPFPSIDERDLSAHRLSIGFALRFFDTTL